MGTAANTSRAIGEDGWRKLIKAHAESGLSVKEWCRENSITERKYYYWRKKLRQLDSEGTDGSQFAEIDPALCLAPSAADPDPKQLLSIQMGDLRLDIHESVPEDLLETVLKVMRHA